MTIPTTAVAPVSPRRSRPEPQGQAAGSESVPERGDGPRSDVVGGVEIGAVVAELLPTDMTAALSTVSAEAIDAVAELVEAATRQVFAPDPLADPGSISNDAEPAHAAAAGVDVRLVDTHLDVAAAVSVLDAVFAPGAGQHFYPPSLLRNLLAAGAPVLLARDGPSPVGVVLALPGWDADGRPLLHSGPMAVLPAARGRGVSVALKLAQRSWAAERDVPEIRWTFDAMVAVNARLNLHRLGATVEAFLPGYEGVRERDQPPSLPYDRLLVTWRLPGADALPHDVLCEPVWAVAPGPDGLPVLDPTWGARPAARVAVPDDIAALRRDFPTAASAWQHAVGHVLQAAVAGGWRVGWDIRGGYLLTAPRARTGPAATGTAHSRGVPTPVRSSSRR